jgi:hypothetical protein
MALVKPIDQQRARQGLRKPSHDVAEPQATAPAKRHPTLAEIEHRRREIESWEVLNVGGYRFAKLGTIAGSVAVVVMVVLAVTPLPPNWPWDIPLAIAAIFTAVGTVVCGLLWFDNPRIGPRPEPLEIVEFGRDENLSLMEQQNAEPFCATCACPGCGQVCAHLIRQAGRDEPGWAAIVRKCGVCQREWAQA